MILLQKFELGHIYTSINHVHFMVVVRRRKKTDYVGLGNPVIKKKLGLFFNLDPQEHFWSSPKDHNFK